MVVVVVEGRKATNKCHAVVSYGEGHVRVFVRG